MRVAAFWAGLAGLLVAGAQATALAAGLLGSPAAPLAAAAGLVADWSLVAFAALVAVFLLLVAFTDRKV